MRPASLSRLKDADGSVRGRKVGRSLAPGHGQSGQCSLSAAHRFEDALCDVATDGMAPGPIRWQQRTGPLQSSFHVRACPVIDILDRHVSHPFASTPLHRAQRTPRQFGNGHRSEKRSRATAFVYLAAGHAYAAHRSSETMSGVAEVWRHARRRREQGNGGLFTGLEMRSVFLLPGPPDSTCPAPAGHFEPVPNL